MLIYAKLIFARASHLEFGKVEALAEHVDYEQLRWLRPEGVQVGTGHYLLSLDAAAEIVRDQQDGPAQDAWRFILECRRRLSAWAAASEAALEMDGFRPAPAAPF